MLRSERGSVDTMAEPRSADTSACSAASTAAGGDIPDCVLSELWTEHSDGVGSPLIDIYTETDCSSQMSDEEPAAAREEVAAAPAALETRLATRDGLEMGDDDLEVLPIAVGEKLIEVVEDDDFGAVAEGGGLIWVVENDVGEGSSETSGSPRRDSGVRLNGVVSSGPELNSPSLCGGSPVLGNRLQRPLAPKRRKPGTKLKHVTKPVSRSRSAKSPRKSLTLGIETARSGAVNANAALTLHARTLLEPVVLMPPRLCGITGEHLSPVHRLHPVESGGPPATSDSAAPVSKPDSLAASAPAEAPGSPEHFSGFPARCWTAARTRWLLQLAGIAAEEREHGDVSPADAALLRLQELAAAVAAARVPPPAAETVLRSVGPDTPAVDGQGDGVPAVHVSSAVTAALSGRPSESAGPPAGGGGDAVSCALPTYVSLMPDAEKDRFKGGFLSQLSLRHVNDPAPPPPRLNRTMRQRLRKRKPAPDDTPEKIEIESPQSAVARSLLSAARRPGALPPARRLKVLRKPGGALLRRSFLAPAQRKESSAAGGDSSGDEAAAAAAARRELRGRLRLLDFGELVEVEGVLDMVDTYSGCDEPPKLLPEPPAADDDGSPPPRPPELPPQRWPRADAARCRVCRKFIARVLLPLHLRLHRTGYRGCDVCGQVLESAAALYRHRLGHEPPRFPCRRCGREFDAPAKLERHRASAHALLCARCGAPVPTPEQVHEHDCDGRKASAPPPPPRPPLPPPPQHQPPLAAAAATATATAAATVAPAASAVTAAEATTAAVETTVPAMTTAANGNRNCGRTGDGFVCDACGKSFLVQFNFTMHMKMVHKRSPVRAERQPPALCPDSVISCLSDILSPDLYSEIVSVV